MITQIGTPQALTTAFNPVKFYYDSTNKNQSGFRYLLEIYSADTNTKLILEDDFAAPRFGDGYGVFSLGTILQAKVPGTLNMANTNAVHAPDSYARYRMKVGESFFNTGWTYSDYEFASIPNSPFNAYTQLRNFNTAVTHNYVVGDQIVITQNDGGAVKPNLNGIQTVVAVLAPNIVVINIPFWVTGSGPTIGGTTNYADRKKTNYRNLFNSNEFVVFNGAKPHIEFPTWDSTQNNANGPAKKWLTSAPNNYMITNESKVWLNFYSSSMSSVTTIEYKNSNGDILQRSIASNTAAFTGSCVFQVAAGTQATPNVVVAGSLPLVKPTTEWISVRMRNAAGYLTEERKFYFDKRCKINDYEVLFKDRMGSYVTFAATLRATVNNDVARKTFKKYLGELSGNKWTYGPKDRGEKVYSIDVSKTFDLNTNFMSEEQSLYFKEMISSGDVYLKLEDGNYWAANIVTNSVEDKTPQNHRLIKYNFSIRLANNDIANV